MQPLNRGKCLGIARVNGMTTKSKRGRERQRGMRKRARSCSRCNLVLRGTRMRSLNRGIGLRDITTTASLFLPVSRAFFSLSCSLLDERSLCVAAFAKSDNLARQ